MFSIPFKKLCKFNFQYKADIQYFQNFPLYKAFYNSKLTRWRCVEIHKDRILVCFICLE